jgi:hypothetical protein
MVRRSENVDTATTPRTRESIAAVVGDHIETEREKLLDHTDRATSIVGDAVEIEDRAAARSGGGLALPPSQLHCRSIKRSIFASGWSLMSRLVPRREEESARSDCWQLHGGDTDRYRAEDRDGAEAEGEARH